MAAYIRLTSRSQAKFKTMKLSHIPFSVRSRACAGFCLSVTSIFALLVIRCESDTHCPSGLSHAFWSLKRSYLMAVTTLASGSQVWTFFGVVFGQKTRLYSVFVGSHTLLTRWRTHVIDCLPQNLISSFPGARTTEGRVTHTFVASSAA